MSQLNERQSLIALNMVTGLGSILIKKLLDYFKLPSRVLAAHQDELVKVFRISSGIARRIKTISSSDEFIAECSEIEHSDISIITVLDDEYPKCLKQIYDPPVVLYALGDMNMFKYPAIAVVGCRRASFYGLQQAERISQGLSGRGICVVSGMARGIDSAAHKAAVNLPGGTIAVLGSGLKVVYPAENKALFETIGKKGLVISEFSLHTSPHRGNFPRRNRIISGLSQGVVVIEAAQRSGSLITANTALDQNREVFAVPGAANSINARGVNALIKDGAMLIENAQDIIDVIGPDKLYNKYMESQLVSGIEDTAPSLDSSAQQLLDLLDAEPLHIDMLIRRSKLDSTTVYRNLLSMQLKGVVKEIEGKRFAKK